MRIFRVAGACRQLLCSVFALNQLQTHFPRKFGAFAVQLYANYVFLDIGFVFALFLQLLLQCNYLGLL